MSIMRLAGLHPIRLVAALCAAGLVAVSNLGCTMEMRERASVRAIDVKKTATAKGLGGGLAWVSATEYVYTSGFSATRGAKESLVQGARAGAAAPAAPAVGETGGKVLVLSLAKLSDVELKRRRIFNAIRWEAGGFGAATIPGEILELATSGLYLPIMIILAVADLAPPPSPVIEVPALTRLKVATAPINPFVSIFFTEMKRSEVMDADETDFHADDAPLNYGARFPLRGQDVTYRLLDASGRVLAEGKARTDAFGEVAVATTGVRPGDLATLQALATTRQVRGAREVVVEGKRTGQAPPPKRADLRTVDGVAIDRCEVTTADGQKLVAKLAR